MVEQIKVKSVHISLYNLKQIKIMKQDLLDFIVPKTLKVEKMKIILEYISVIFTSRCTQLFFSINVYDSVHR